MGAFLWQIVYFEGYVHRRVFLSECAWAIVCRRVSMGDCVASTSTIWSRCSSLFFKTLLIGNGSYANLF